MAHGRKTGGRQRGAPNRITKEVKECLELAFAGAGGVPALTAWAKKNPDGFYPVWAKLLPRDVKLGGELKHLGVILMPAEVPDK
jgi:hypothetical protein